MEQGMKECTSEARSTEKAVLCGRMKACTMVRSLITTFMDLVDKFESLGVY